MPVNTSKRGWSGMKQVHACTAIIKISRDVERVGN